jgi:CheY-like chemotaxis protein
VAERQNLSLQARTLRQVVDVVGSVEPSSRLLHVSVQDLEAWLDGNGTVPRPAFLRAVEFVVRNLEAIDNVGRARGSGSALRRRVLVVDDNIDSAVTLAAVIRYMGHEVQVAHEGHEAVRAARRSRPDFVFLDIGLPGLDGLQVAASLRQDSTFDGVRIVAITGHAREEQRQQARESGIDYYLLKPADLAFIESLLGSAAKAGPY